MPETKTFHEAMKAIMKEKGVTTTELAGLAGVRQSSVSSLLSKGNPSIRSANRYLVELGHSLAIVPLGAELPDGCVLVTDGGNGAAFRSREDIDRNLTLKLYRDGLVEVAVGGRRAWVDGTALDAEGADTECDTPSGERHMVRMADVTWHSEFLDKLLG